MQRLDAHHTVGYDWCRHEICADSAASKMRATSPCTALSIGVVWNALALESCGNAGPRYDCGTVAKFVLEMTAAAVARDGQKDQ